jgi:hypothetical protein
MRGTRPGAHGIHGVEEHFALGDHSGIDPDTVDVLKTLRLDVHFEQTDVLCFQRSSAARR